MKVLLYSPEQKAFHVEDLQQTCKLNFEKLIKKEDIQFHIIAVVKDEDVDEVMYHFEGLLRPKN
jgi:hypothetical protein